MSGWIWPSRNGIAVRLLLLLLLAEVPLVVFTVGVTLRNDQLQARDAVARVAAAQATALAELDASMRAAHAAAVAASLLHQPLITRPADCRQVLAALIAANDHPVASVTLRDDAGHPFCSSDAGAPPRPPLSPARHLESLDGRLALIQPLAPNMAGTATVLLARPGDHPALMLWVHTPGTWLAAGPAAAAALPALPPQIGGAKVFRQRARNGRAFLYTTLPLPGGPDADMLLAGSDIGSAASASARTFGLRIGELIVFFVTECFLVAAGVNWLVTQPLARLNRSVDRWRTSGRFTELDHHDEPEEVRVLGQSFTEASTALNHRERDLHAAVARHELVMQEIHHRVKNNLQIIASLLNLQAARIKVPEAKAEFASARDRVRALATLHRHLYANGDLHLIDMRAFFAELCTQLFQALDETEGDRIGIEIVAPDVTISTDQAVPIALIVTETVGNALKHAFPDGRRGTIRVRFELKDENSATLTVGDDGVGLAEQAADAPRSGLGLQLIRGFAAQLGARLTLTTDQGTCYRLDMSIERQRLNTIALGKPRQAA